jgi:hypothetical protein
VHDFGGHGSKQQIGDLARAARAHHHAIALHAVGALGDHGGRIAGLHIGSAGNRGRPRIRRGRLKQALALGPLVRAYALQGLVDLGLAIEDRVGIDVEEAQLEVPALPCQHDGMVERPGGAIRSVHGYQQPAHGLPEQPAGDDPAPA